VTASCASKLLQNVKSTQLYHQSHTNKLCGAVLDNGCTSVSGAQPAGAIIDSAKQLTAFAMLKVA
jgi:hypothetical protein